MPFTAADAKRHIKGLSSSQEAAWAKIANSVLADCDAGKDECEGRAIRIANDRAKRVAKADEKGLVSGWASVVLKDGEVVEDTQGDVIPPEELEKALHEFMRDHRAVNEMHRGDQVGTVVEAVVMSPGRALEMGFPPDAAATAPTGAFIVVKLDPASETFQKVKRGELQMFSIEGEATRVPV